MSGVAQVPDHRLDALAEMSSSKKVVHAGVELVDIAGLVAGSSTGEGLGNRFLGGIREADAICLVLRAFEDPNVPGGNDPLEDLAVLELELVLADLASAETQLERRRKAAKQDQFAGRRRSRRSNERRPCWPTARLFIAPASPATSANSCARSSCSPTSRLLTVVNLGEDVVAGGRLARQADDRRAGAAAEVLASASSSKQRRPSCPQRTAPRLMEGLGLGEGALPRVAQAAYRLLGRRTFFTTGDKESRAWTFRSGAKAPECAGVIHSDLQRGFIRAEVVHWDELLKLGSWAAARDVGKLRVEGKEYEVVDGDVLEIRFNV